MQDHPMPPVGRPNTSRNLGSTAKPRPAMACWDEIWTDFGIAKDMTLPENVANMGNSSRKHWDFNRQMLGVSHETLGFNQVNWQSIEGSSGV